MQLVTTLAANELYYFLLLQKFLKKVFYPLPSALIHWPHIELDFMAKQLSVADIAGE